VFKLVRYLKNYKKQLILGPLFKLTEAVFELIVPIITALIIDKGVLKNDVSYVLKMGGVLIFLGVVGLACALICQYSASIASQGFGTALRNDIYKHINSFSHKEIDKFGTPSLITRITNDVNQLQFAVAMLIRLVIRAPFLAVGAVIMAMIVDVKLSLVFLVVTPIIAVILYVIMKRSVPFFKLAQKKLDNISRISREGLSGARVIRAFSKQKSEEMRFSNAAREQADISIKVSKLSSLLNPLTYAVMNLGIVALLWFGGGRVAAGDRQPGEVVALVNYMTQTYLALVVVANLVVIFTKAAASAARVNEIFETEPSVKEGSGNISQENESFGKIFFKDVSFSYVSDDEKFAVKDLNVVINEGETVGIIGGTGAGKSTFVKLIPRFYDCSKGQIYIDGRAVEDYPLNELRLRIGMVPQKAVIFSGTVESNLRWGKEDATEDEMYKALEIAQARDFVEKLPDGLKSMVLQGGKNFSGGQKQRLTIARALIQKPDILILDDSASALDLATDARLRKAIYENLKNTTVIIVSQRTNSIKNADKIIVFENGEVAGMGRHEELLKSCPVYKEIHMSQSGTESEEGAL